MSTYWWPVFCGQMGAGALDGVKTMVDIMLPVCSPVEFEIDAATSEGQAKRAYRLSIFW